jgi:DNA invertase Pin-like site-specific DNA recombinase
MKAAEFNENFKVVAKKDYLSFKEGQELYFKDTVLLINNLSIPPVLSDKEVQEARLMYEQGKSYREIGKLFKVSHMTIYRALKLYANRDSAL